MTIADTTRRAGTFVGNGVTTAFPFTFKVFATTDIAVVFANSFGTESTLVLNSDYSVTLNADQEVSPGGTVTFPISGSPMAETEALAIIGGLPYSQPTALPNGGAYNASIVERALDRLAVLIQQIRENSSRYVQLGVTSPSSTSIRLPPPSANKAIGWNPDATALTNLDPTVLASNIVATTWKIETFNGNGTNTVFNLAQNPGSANAVICSVGGVVQTPGLNFRVTGQALTFLTGAPPAGILNVMVQYGQSLPSISSGVVSGSSRTVPVIIPFATTMTVDAAVSNVFYLGTLTGPATLAIVSPSDGQTINIRVQQDATGGRVLTLPGGSTVRVGNGTAPIAPNAISWLILTFVSSINAWEGNWTISPSTVGIQVLTAADQAAAQAALGITSASLSSIGAAARGANTDITSLNAPALGAATATTQSGADNSTKVATTAMVQAAVAGINVTGVGVGQAWQNVTGSRAIGTTYTNSTGKPIMVAFNIQSLSGNQSISVSVGGVALPGFGLAVSGTSQSSSSFIVPNGSTYVINATSCALAAWHELR